MQKSDFLVILMRDNSKKNLYRTTLPTVTVLVAPRIVVISLHKV